jgi:hypothetical protein
MRTYWFEWLVGTVTFVWIVLHLWASRPLKGRRNVRDGAWAPTGYRQDPTAYDEQKAVEGYHRSQRQTETGRIYRRSVTPPALPGPPPKPKSGPVVY